MGEEELASSQRYAPLRRKCLVAIWNIEAGDVNSRLSRKTDYQKEEWSAKQGGSAC